MRRFQLKRKVDHSGVSGIGIVCEGVEFSDGTVALRWLGSLVSTAIYANVDVLMQIHGYGGDTILVWIDEAEGPF